MEKNIYKAFENAKITEQEINLMLKFLKIAQEQATETMTKIEGAERIKEILKTISNETFNKTMADEKTIKIEAEIKEIHKELETTLQIVPSLITKLETIIS